MVAIDDADGDQVTGWISPEDGRRIVACVNAMEGIPDDNVLFASEGSVRSTLVSMKAQRDALLAALEAIAAEDYEAPHDATDADISYEKGRLIMRIRRAAQAAIAAAKGGAV